MQVKRCAKIIHKNVENCFQICDELFKTVFYHIAMKGTEAVSRSFRFVELFFLPLFFPNPYMEKSAAFKQRTFSVIMPCY